MSDFAQAYQNLNPEQKMAVDQIDGPVMVIAGAGTGKTQLLAVRIAHILKETDLNPYNILCLTFTDAGVIAMRRRLLQIIGTAAYHVKVCTFHSFCNEVIRENPEEFLFHREFEQIDDLEKIQLIQSLIDETEAQNPLKPSGDPYYYQKNIANNIRNLKQEGISPQQFSTTIENLCGYLEVFNPLIRPFTEIKGQPKPEDIKQIEQITPPDTEGISTIYAEHFRNLLQNFRNSLTGEKRPDGTRRTSLRNSLKDFFIKAENEMPKLRILVELYKNYQNKLHEKARYDYEDMIMFVTEKFVSNQNLLRDYQEKYQYILVDEYQDTNSAQNKTVDLLASYFDNPNLFVVGDDDQSIYRFQGASIENIIAFHKRYEKHLRTITLTKNYRSQQSILSAATELIKNNQVRIANSLPEINKELISQLQLPEQPIKLLTFQTEQTEIFAIAKKIQKLIEEGTPASEIAVLYRNHFHAADLIELLRKLGIPFSVKPGINILEDLQIGKLLQLFQTIENPNDNAQLSATLFLDFLKLNSTKILKILHDYQFTRKEKTGISLHTHLLSLDSQQTTIDGQSPSNPFAALATQIAQFKADSHNLNLPTFFEKVVKQSGFLSYLLEQTNRVEALNKLNTLFQLIKDSTRKNHQLTISNFLENLKLHAENDLKILENPIQSHQETIQLMSAHGAKGLEFEHVFLIKVTHRNWCNTTSRDKIKLPAGMINQTIEDGKMQMEEDERRLFYVALTRAKKEVYLSYSKTKSEDQKAKENEPVKFIEEIPDDLIERIDTQQLEDQISQQLETIFLDETPDQITIPEQGFLKQLAERHVISATSLNNYLTCPRKFFYQSLIRIPQAKNKNMAMGTAIHGALDSYFKKYQRSRTKPPKEALLLRFEQLLEKELLTSKEHNEKLKLGQKVLSDYYDTHNQSFTPDIFTEYNFSSQGVNLDGIPIKGKIDKIESSSNGLVITDFKTGNADRGMTKIKPGEDYWRQIIFYKILCDLSPQFHKQFQGQMQSGRLEFLEKSRQKNEYLTPEVPLTSEAIDEVKASIRLVHQQINDLQFGKIEKSEPCERCPFNDICWQTK